MDNESIPKQLGVGAFVGVFLLLMGRINRPDETPLLSAAGLLQIVGSAVAGAVIYTAIQQFRQRKK